MFLSKSTFKREKGKSLIPRLSCLGYSAFHIYTSKVERMKLVGKSLPSHNIQGFTPEPLVAKTAGLLGLGPFLKITDV